jgi:membrane associated rhomboid family serine protease
MRDKDIDTKLTMIIEPPDTSWATVATTPDERRCAELALVLTARGVDSQKVFSANGWRLLVPANDAERALAELASYATENSRAIGTRRVVTIGFGLPGVVAYCAVLLVVFVCVRQSVFGLDWYGTGRLHAGRVVAGEWWRTVTALTVHVDLDHIAGNLGFGAFFGYFVGRYLGPGVGWLAIVTAASAANFVNAIVQSPAHRSIGASTAVFAALGLLTAYTWRRGFLRETPWRARIAPIVAGLGLLAFTGTSGEDTDLFAHLAGFVCGFLSGWLLARFVRLGSIRPARVQTFGAAAAMLLVAGAWIWGLAAVG